MSSRRKAVSVIGPNQTRCNVDVYNFGLELGRSLADAGYVIICGGMFGFMEAVCKGARSASFRHGMGPQPTDNKFGGRGGVRGWRYGYAF